jgi:hypothetical protein
MTQAVSRRFFLAVTGSALIAPPIVSSPGEVPALLDHILLGCNNLDRGIDFVYQHTGVRAAFGGVHPGVGTQNALVSLGERRYLEIIAPDPKQPGVTDSRGLKKLADPRLVGWAAHPGDVQSFADRLTRQGVAITGPQPGSRKRPDGRVLTWKIVALKDDSSGLLPFFIEWSADSIHPSVDAPQGCRLISFEALAPDPDSLSKKAAQLGLDVSISKAEKPQLRAILAGPKGELSVTS